MKFAIGFFAIVFCAASNAASAIDERVDAGSATTLEVRNAFGTVVITGSQRDDVHVTGSLADDASQLDVQHRGNRLIVNVEYPERRQSRGAVEGGSMLQIAAPASLSVVVDSVSAGIEIDGMQGEQRLNSVSGDIITTVSEAETQVRTVSGNVAVTGRGAATRLETSSVSGNVDVSAVSGEVNSQNVSGTITLQSADLNRAEIQTVSGDISVDAMLSEDGRLQARSTSGRIELYLQDSPGSEFELSTFSGRIDNCFGPEPTRPQFGPPSSSLQFAQPDASAQVFATSMSGDIVLCEER